MTDETIKIRFLIDKKEVRKRLKYKDMKMIRKFKPGDVENLEQLQTIVCRFMANDAGEYLPFEQAYATFDELSQEEAEDAINKFTQVFQEVTIPNEREGQSNSTLPVASLTPLNSPTGQDSQS
jgi:hypothetical protein